MYQTRFRHGALPWYFCAAVVLQVLSTQSHAATINNLFNTGVNNVGAAVGTGMTDLHYTIFSPIGYTATTVDDTNFPFPPWLANNTGSRWIGPATNSVGPGGPWEYRTTFTVPPTAILSSVVVNGDWIPDDTGTNIHINGTPTGQTSTGYGTLIPFTVSSGFVFGTNTLSFFITNAPSQNATGLRVDNILGIYQIPEPGTAVLFAAAFLISTITLRRSRSTTLAT